MYRSELKICPFELAPALSLAAGEVYQISLKVSPEKLSSAFLIINNPLLEIFWQPHLVTPINLGEWLP